ncbi:MAG: hypothetical protein ILA34_04775 [Bacteroidaceae bacterium]|nr:hypothetical protein [Bacteroidaceae bacterium]
MILFVLIALALLLAVILLRRATSQPPRQAGTEESASTQPPAAPCEGEQADCGITCFCDDRNLQDAMRSEILYYEDEELDAYKNIPAEAYTAAQVEDFSEVLTTLRPKEIRGWLHSLEMRGIQLPNTLRDEAFMLMESAVNGLT